MIIGHFLRFCGGKEQISFALVSHTVTQFVRISINGSQAAALANSIQMRPTGWTLLSGVLKGKEVLQMSNILP